MRTRRANPRPRTGAGKTGLRSFASVLAGLGFLFVSATGGYAAELTAAELAALDILPHGDQHLFEQPDPPPPPDRKLKPAAVRDAALGGKPGKPSQTLPAWRRYAALSTESGSGPLVAIVIDDMGHAERHLTPAFQLGVPLTLAFLPYPDMTRPLADKARNAGFEILVHMPMEPGDPNADPGPGALLSGLDEESLRESLRRNLDALEGYVGINNHMGSKFTRDANAMGIIMDELASRGLLYLDSITTGQTQGWREAEKRRLPYAKRDVFLDNEPTPDAVLSQLELLEARARKYGYAVAIGHPYKATYEGLRQWLPEARARGIEIVPLSTIAAIECAC